MKRAWHVVEPENQFADNWHIKAVCDHLEAITAGEITRLLINVPPGMMKALEENTPVLTLDGWKRHGDLAPGDYVYGPDGLPKRVIACTPEVLEEAFAVRFDDGTTIEAGGAHEWVIERDFMDAESNWRRVRREMVVETTDLKAGARGDRIATSKEVYQPSRDLLIDPYVLGAWLGDGASRAGCLYASEDDIEHFRQFGEIRHTYEPSGTRKKRFYRVLIDGLTIKLRALGLMNNKHVPESYLLASASDRLALLQGLLDTDGCATKEGLVTFSNKNEGLVDAVRQLVSMLGAKSFKKKRFTTLNGKRYGPHFFVSFVPPKGVEVFRLKRKQDRVRQSENVRTFSHYIKAVESVGKRVTKCIQVEGGVYLAGKSLIPTHNSLLVSVLWPAWEWGPKGRSSYRYFTTTYAEDYAIRDSRRMRDLVESEWFQTLWGDRVILTKTGEKEFHNTKTGWRKGVPFTRLTGGRGDRLIIDDPHSTSGADSDAERRRAVRLFRESATSRLNNPMKSAIVVIMQRLHEGDISGEIIENGGYVHLMLPMEFDPDRRCRTIIGFVDPRKEKDELLFPALFPREAVNRDKQWMGSFAVAGQYQQEPVPRQGGMFKRHDFKIVDAAPAGGQICRGWDHAATEDVNAAATAGVLLKFVDGDIYIMDCVREQVGPSAAERLIESTVKEDARNYGNQTRQDFPQEPGAAGKILKSHLSRKLSGYNVRFSPETGSKEARATPLAAQVEAGNVYLVKGSWNKDFLDEVAMFPRGKFKDRVDAMTRAYGGVLAMPKPRTHGAGMQQIS